jgi:hypothetical protein
LRRSFARLLRPCHLHRTTRLGGGGAVGAGDRLPARWAHRPPGDASCLRHLCTASADTWLVAHNHRRAEWGAGDTISLTLDLTTWCWAGEREAAGQVALYQGPILLAYDPRFDTHDPIALPALDLRRAPQVVEPVTPAPHPLLLRRFATQDGGAITLCDFASAGAAGNHYVSWLPAPGLLPAPFTRENPLRLVHAVAADQ